MPAFPPTLAALFLAASTTSASITIDTVVVGDKNNPNDTTNNGNFGAVAYDYHIGTYEVTNSQYTAFLNAVASTSDTHGLYNTHMSISENSGTYSTSAPNEPVAHVSFWDSARFANWLTNGQPTGEQGNGTTEDGMYNLGGVTNPTNTDVSRQLDFSLGQNGVAVASEDEWVKAAYYDGSAGYYDYPTQSNDAPTAEAPSGGDNSANFNKALNSVTEVGAYPNSGSHYGTFDQGGNVWEWNDEILSTSDRMRRGGAFNTIGVTNLLSRARINRDPIDEVSYIGFRVTSLGAIPEPSSYGAIFGIVGLATAVFFRRRRRRE